ncbi:hypothetical protein GQ55_8G199500 [Panicum hallii var. hallii]|jgi:hypothetical protein|uniref:Uncharacterized protein n=1 Tax=Panicum hallii var. hallii TaxID=1504633 RepID=A0A2T7CPH1_9POAL|nr:hypothetical protein GQ55_8G199500 [Panicum hallii var. hallii]
MELLEGDISHLRRLRVPATRFRTEKKRTWAIAGRQECKRDEGIEQGGGPSHLDVLDLAGEGEKLLHVLRGGGERYVCHLDSSDLKQRGHQTRSIYRLPLGAYLFKQNTFK